MRLALFLPSTPNDMWYLGSELGVADAVTSMPVAAPGGPIVWDYLSMVVLRQKFADIGLNASVIESSPPMEKIRLGIDGREEELEGLFEFITNMGAAGFRVWCYNWMAAFNWLRTSITTVDRGGALVTSYDHDLMKNAPHTKTGVVTEEQLWDSYAWFIERIVPIAAAANVKMALHPDDPPLSPIRGVARIMSSIEHFDRALDLNPDPHHTITFCQGNFRLMTDDIPAAVRHFQEKRGIPFVHFRDVRGDKYKFKETFHDDGPTDMLGAMAAYHEIGFDGPMRPDHVPTMYGDPNDPPGYTNRGRLYAIGYMRGLWEAVSSGRFT
jgi:mannonate dehydratase